MLQMGLFVFAEESFHHLGWCFPALQAFLHVVHVGRHMFEELVVALTEIVVAILIVA